MQANGILSLKLRPLSLERIRSAMRSIRAEIGQIIASKLVEIGFDRGFDAIESPRKISWRAFYLRRPSQVERLQTNSEGKLWRMTR